MAFRFCCHYLIGFFACFALFIGAPAQAEVRLANIFADHMVLQRDMPIRVWGYAEPGEKIAVQFRKQSVQSVADGKGRWVAILNNETAGGPDVLRVRGSSTIELQDVLVGEVWVCGGQSNMEWPLKETLNAGKELAGAQYPWLRHIKIPKLASFKSEDDIARGAWLIAAPEVAGDFSAVAYYFAKQLHAHLQVPIGLISVNWGGSQLESWLSPEGMQEHRELAAHVPMLPNSLESYRTTHRQKMAARVSAWQTSLPLNNAATSYWRMLDYDDTNWPYLNVPQYWEEQGLESLDGVVWYRKRIHLSARQSVRPATLHLGMIDDCDETWVNSDKLQKTCGWDQKRHYALSPGVLKVGDNVIALRVTDTGGGGGFHGQAKDVYLEIGGERIDLSGKWRARVEQIQEKDSLQHNDLPTILYKGMIHPIQGYSIRGVIWYQGETNVPRAAQYANTFPLLIRDWRRHWGQGDFPFYFVQLASYLPIANNNLQSSPWAELRESQRLALGVPNTAMAVTTDIGDEYDIHPRNKADVGYRLALQALRSAYGRDLVASGPLYLSHRIQGHEIILNFAEIGSGLATRVPGDSMRGFTIAGKNQKFMHAHARIEGEKLIVWHEALSKPEAVRYGWVNNPSEANLVNREGLPASPFRTDDWPLTTQHSKFGLD